MDSIQIRVDADNCSVTDEDVRTIVSSVIKCNVVRQRNEYIPKCLVQILFSFPSEVCNIISGYCVLSSQSCSVAEGRLYATLEKLEKEDSFDLTYYSFCTEDYTWARRRLAQIHSTRLLLRNAFNTSSTLQPEECSTADSTEGAKSHR